MVRCCKPTPYLAAWFCVLGFFFGFAAPSGAQEKDIKDLAEQVFKTLRGKLKKKDAEKQRLLIVPFQLGNTPATEYGKWLAVRFAEAISQKHEEFQIVSYDELAQALHSDMIPEAWAGHLLIARYLAVKTRAAFLIYGTYELSSTGAFLTLDVEEKSKAKSFGRIRGELTLLPDKLFLAKKYLPEGIDLQAFEFAAPPVSSPIFKPGMSDVIPPQCQFCPHPPYSDAARSAKFEGTVKLRVVVSAEGRVFVHKVVAALPLGLTRAAVEAVQKWRLYPATKDGVPVAIEMQIEVTFRLLK
ncbi:MAG TPA: energy transducer TonB [Candidatus Nitrosotenuis sp.]|nr:energy transducer TonB [Candidatus Nitrosotenuis sp.]